MTSLLKLVQTSSLPLYNGSSILLNFTRNFASRSTQIKIIEEKLGYPAKPKKPINPYMKFMADIRPTIATGNKSATDVVKEVAALWRTIDSNKKQKYTDAYEKDQATYNAQLAVYKSKISDDQLSKYKAEVKLIKADEKKSQKKKNNKIFSNELGKPKRGLNSFFLFVYDEKKKSSVNLSKKELTAKWDALSVAEKKPYIDKANELMESYKKELLNWEKEMIKAGHTELLRKNQQKKNVEKNPKKSE